MACIIYTWRLFYSRPFRVSTIDIDYLNRLFYLYPFTLLTKCFTFLRLYLLWQDHIYLKNPAKVSNRVEIVTIVDNGSSLSVSDDLRSIVHIKHRRCRHVIVHNDRYCWSQSLSTMNASPLSTKKFAIVDNSNSISHFCQTILATNELILVPLATRKEAIGWSGNMVMEDCRVEQLCKAVEEHPILWDPTSKIF